MATTTSYNEQVKLTASLINLMAAGVMTVGVITPLVSLLYGTHLVTELEPMSVAVDILYLLVIVWSLHGLAILTLRSLI